MHSKLFRVTLNFQSQNRQYIEGLAVTAMNGSAALTKAKTVIRQELPDAQFFPNACTSIEARSGVIKSLQLRVCTASGVDDEDWMFLPNGKGQEA